MFFRTKSYSLPVIDQETTESTLQSNTREYYATHEISKGETTTVKHNPFWGFFYTFLTCLFYASIAVIVKKLSYINPGQLTFIRNAGIFAGILPIEMYCVKELFGEKKYRLLLIVRGCLGATTLYCATAAYKLLPIAEATIVMSTLPVVTTVVARVVLKEACGIVQSLLLIATVCGVLLSLRLPELLSKRRDYIKLDYAYMGGLAAAVGCVIGLSITFVVLRKMRDIHFSVPVLYIGVFGMLENGSITLFTSGFVPPRCGWNQILILLMGILDFLANLVFTLALQAELAGIVSALQTMQIVIAMVFQIIFFDEILDASNISGGCLVVLSLSMMGIRKWILTLPEESNVRKRFKYLLL